MGVGDVIFKIKYIIGNIFGACCYNVEKIHRVFSDLHEITTQLNLPSNPPYPLPTFCDPCAEYDEVIVATMAAGPSHLSHGKGRAHSSCILFMSPWE